MRNINNSMIDGRISGSNVVASEMAPAHTVLSNPVEKTGQNRNI